MTKSLPGLVRQRGWSWKTGNERIRPVKVGESTETPLSSLHFPEEYGLFDAEMSVSGL